MNNYFEKIFFLFLTEHIFVLYFFQGGGFVKELSLIEHEPALLRPELFDIDFYLKHYPLFLKMDLAGGRPSYDTMRTYLKNIDAFLCFYHKSFNRHVMNALEHDIIVYREVLQNKYAVKSVALKLTAVRRFYESAVRREIIRRNPAKYVTAGRDPNAVPVVHYLTEGQLEYLIRIMPRASEREMRDRLMVWMMGVEGLRTIEVMRLSVEDISWDRRTIFIHGKGHNDDIYPRAETFLMIEKYLAAKEMPIPKDDDGTPLFSVVSNNNLLGRMTRDAIRDAVDFWLEKAGFRNPEEPNGASCHLLRHTCGTLLLKNTNNLKVVQETLRHKSPKQASEYAHLQDRLLKRYTEAIPIKVEI